MELREAWWLRPGGIVLWTDMYVALCNVMELLEDSFTASYASYFVLMFLVHVVLLVLSNAFFFLVTVIF